MKACCSELLFVLNNCFAELLFVEVGLVQERVLEQLSGCRALLFVLDQTLADEIGKVSRPLGSEWRHFRVQDLQKDFLLVSHLSVWRINVGKFERKDAKRPNIN